MKFIMYWHVGQPELVEADSIEQVYSSHPDQPADFYRQIPAYDEHLPNSILLKMHWDGRR